MSGVLAAAFYPLYENLLEKFAGRKNLASLSAVFLVLIFIVVPALILSAFLIKEAVDLYNNIVLGGSSQVLIAQADGLSQKFSAIFPYGAFDMRMDFSLYARNALNWIVGNFSSLSAAVFDGILKFILMIISIFYLFISGERIKKGILTWSPLPDKYDEEFIKTLRLSIDAVLRGRILVAFVQGALIGLGFAVFGIGSPVLWGFVGAVASLVPILGTSIIIIPAAAYLFLSGQAVFGIGLIIWGALLVGLADNFISAAFLKNRMKIHPLVILFSILGGVEIFGVAGFLVGPVAVSAFIALMKIYPFILSYKSEQ